MSTRFATLDPDGRITRVYRGKRLQESDVLVPEQAPISAGMSRSEFDEDWALRPLAARVKDGLVQIPPRFKVDGENLVPKALAELVSEGLEPIPPGQKLLGERFVPMSKAEKLEAGLLYPEEEHQVKLGLCLARRYDAYVAELDPIRFDIDRARINGEAVELARMEALYRAKDAEIRKRFPKP